MGAVNFFSNIFWPLSQITAKHKRVPKKLNYSSQLIIRALRKILRNDRKLKQQTEHRSELKRPNYEHNRKSKLRKMDRISHEIIDQHSLKNKDSRGSALHTQKKTMHSTARRLPHTTEIVSCKNCAENLLSLQASICTS